MFFQANLNDTYGQNVITSPSVVFDPPEHLHLLEHGCP